MVDIMEVTVLGIQVITTPGDMAIMVTDMVMDMVTATATMVGDTPIMDRIGDIQTGLHPMETIRETIMKQVVVICTRKVVVALYVILHHQLLAEAETATVQPHRQVEADIHA